MADNFQWCESCDDAEATETEDGAHLCGACASSLTLGTPATQRRIAQVTR